MTKRPQGQGASAPTSTSPTPIKLPINGLTIDPEIQQRTRVDEALIAEYAENIGDWIHAAPIVVFSDGYSRFVADGFQRTEAARRAGLYEIPAIQFNGTRQDALRYALSANATHGRRRSREDLERAYATAVREGFCQAADTECVASLLKCSARWASELTKLAREAAKIARDAEIQRLAEDGKSQREIAEQVGVSVGSVNATVQKWNTSKTERIDPVAPPLANDYAQGDTAPEPIIVEEIEGDDLAAIRDETDKLHAETAAPAPATPAPKPPTAKDAMHAAHRVTGLLGLVRQALEQVEDAEVSLLESDARILIRELRTATDRLVARFGAEEVGHA
ncbi:ParB-like nuclease domain-containing protein [Allochromatium warmingii]|uniref:ParB-like nuclease domain-containing protein n=1 Tax=Allochromatium warmingii TaxID=61595 RepID=A0A1H3DVI3_ALLWA|nr:helix-turn-helix domain-containing protein [Allochromatium warmingii]SDX70340.1 ParB-like nuclease domain-containing protein [Allochromatium warmingii]